jgi:hypothetical protein
MAREMIGDDKPDIHTHGVVSDETIERLAAD